MDLYSFLTLFTVSAVAIATFSAHQISSLFQDVDDEE